MTLRIVLNSWVPLISRLFGVRAQAVTLGRWIFVARGVRPTARLVRHETIHVWQWDELLWIGFAALYTVFWLQGLILHRSARQAYLAIPFEQEARDGQSRPKYLQTRDPYAWRRFSARRPIP